MIRQRSQLQIQVRQVYWEFGILILLIVLGHRP